MATNIVLRSIKASALNHAEMDQNWESLARTVESIVADQTLVLADQNKIFESDYVSGIVTLLTVALASTAHTDSFRFTIKNINASPLTVDAAPGDLIEGNATILLLENESASFSLASDKSEWSIISFYGQSLVGIVATPAEINTLSGYNGNVNDHNISAGGFAAGVSAAEFQRLSNVTSDIQAQLDSKLVAINNLSDLPNKATSRSNLVVDIAGTDNSVPVTLVGTPSYLSLVGQQLTKGLVDLATDVSGALTAAQIGDNSITTPKLVNDAATAPKIAIGATVYMVAGPTSGTFTAQKTGSHLVTLVGGGGAGGGGNSGGGGNEGGEGGKTGYCYSVIQQLTAGQNYAYTVGAGGSPSSGNPGGAGANSTFNGLTANGGVGGGTGALPGQPGESSDYSGSGGKAVASNTNGLKGTGYGSGGGGSGETASARPGGAGFEGLLKIEW